MTSGSDATTADIADSSNKRYVTDAQLIVIGNTSNTNTGDQTLSSLGAVAANAPITPGTNTKIKYDAKGLVTSSGIATTADIADSLNKRYITDSELTILTNTSGTNSGDNSANSNSGLVHTSGTETINGVKTFGSFPVTPSSSPTTNYQIANKKYVDDATLGGNLWDQTSTGITPRTPGVSINFGTSGLRDHNITTPILFSDSSNLSLISDNKTIIGAMNETYQEVKNLESTTLVWGGELSINSDPTKFNIKAGEALIVDNHTDPDNPTTVTVGWLDQYGLDAPLLLTDPTSYLYVDDAGIFHFKNDILSPGERRFFANIGWLDHPDNTIITGCKIQPDTGTDLASQLNDFLLTNGAFVIYGVEYKPLTALQVERTDGQIFNANANYFEDKTSPHTLPVLPQNPVPFYYYYRDGMSGWVNPVITTAYIDPDHYDDGTGVLATVPTDMWTVQVMSYYPQTNLNDIQYGQKVYSSYAEARTAIQYAVEVNPYNAVDTFICWLVIKQGCPDLTNPLMAVFSPASNFRMKDLQYGSGIGGEVNDIINDVIGIGAGTIFKEKIGVNLILKRIATMSSKLTIINGNDDIQLDVNVSKSDVGIPNVTNDAQVKKISSSTIGHIMSWATSTGDVPADSGISVSSVSTVVGNSYIGSMNQNVSTSSNVTFASIKDSNLTPSIVLTSDASHNIVSSSSGVTELELSYLHGTASGIQSQINGKQPTITAGTTSQYYRGDKTFQDLTIDTLSDVIITLPVNGERLTYNGLNWVNSPSSTINAGSGVIFYPTEVQSDLYSSTGYFYFEKAPDNVPQLDLPVVCNNNKVYIIGYVSDPSISLTTIPAGPWSIYVWGYTNSTASNSHLDVDIYVRTSTGVETFLFGMVTANLTTVLQQLSSLPVIRPALTFAAGERLVFKISAQTSSLTDVTIHAVGGDSTISYITTPYVTQHNDLPGLQGGSSGEEYHLTYAKAVVVNNTSNTNTGDETISTIKTKLGITTLSGSNTGDQVADGISITGAGTVGSPFTAVGFSGAVTGAASSTNNNVVFFNGSTGKIIKDNGIQLTGSNTGDETTSSIKTKLGPASLSSDGYLTSTGYALFNNKQNALTNPITGTGSTGQFAQFNSSTGITGVTENTAFNKNFEASTLNIQMNGAVALGSSGNVADASHIHPSDTSRVPITTTVNGKALSSNITLGLASADFGNQGTIHTVLHGNASGPPSFNVITEADISFSNNTTNNVSISAHGLAPILSNVATQFLNGQGNWVIPAGLAEAYLSQSYNSLLTITITHNFGAYPVVQVLDSSGNVILPYGIKNNSINDFTVTFDIAFSGNILATVGSPPLSQLIVVNGDYVTVSTDYIVEETAINATVTMITAVGRAGKIQVIKNASVGVINLNCYGSEKIDNSTLVNLTSMESLTLYSNGTNWRII